MMPSEMMPPPGGTPKGAAPMPPKDDMSKGGSSFDCPSCGAKLMAQPADEEMGEGDMSGGAGGDMGGGAGAGY